MLHKITFEVSEKKFKRNKVIDFFENVVFEEKNKNWKVDIITNDFKKDLSFLKFYLKIINKLKVEIVENKNWILSSTRKDRPVLTNLFTISQKKLSVVFTKKFLQIPASTAFGTGKHNSTFLTIKNIEFLLKKKKFFRFLDLGAGTGILSFVLSKIYRKRVFATDVEIESEKCLKKIKK